MKTIINILSRIGHPRPDQTIIEEGNKEIFVSYGTRIAEKKNGQVRLDRYYWNYSQTTGKYRNMFLRETKSQTEQKIKQGVYKLDDLNPEK
jgi:hypothetical protein